MATYKVMTGNEQDYWTEVVVGVVEIHHDENAATLFDDDGVLAVYPLRYLISLVKVSE